MVRLPPEMTEETDFIVPDEGAILAENQPDAAKVG